MSEPSRRLAPGRDRTLRVACAALILGVALAGCAEDEPGDTPGSGEPRYVTDEKPLQGWCTANVNGQMVPTETDYLPHVVACENGAADFEALKAQAVAARGYLFYRMETAGSIGDGQSDQVYTCGRPPSQVHYDAVAATSGEYLEYNGQIVAPFYVAGSVPSNRTSCRAVAGDNDYSNTERYVTYNEGKSGSNVTQTTLGWVNANNFRNRGCQSQNGANCLSQAGRNHHDILRFYYGADIGIRVAEGACFSGPTPTSCTPRIDGDEVIIDQTDGCFVGGCSDSTVWNTVSEGYGGSHVFTYAWDQADDCVGRWRLDFEQGGEYEVEVHIQTTAPLTTSARYVVRHAGQETPVTLSQAAANGGWAPLGRFVFAAGEDQHVRLGDNTGEPYGGTSGKRVVFDAIRVRRYVPSTPADESGEDTAPGPDTSPGEDTAPGSDISPDDAIIGEPDVSDATIDADSDISPTDITASDLAGGDAQAPVAGQEREIEGACGCRTLAAPASPARLPLALSLGVALGGLALLRRRRAGRGLRRGAGRA